MTISHHYFSPTTPGHASWDETITSVSLGGKPGFVMYAELGQVGMGSVVIDDPDADVGHTADAIVGLKQWYVTETACPAGDERLFTGYIGARRYSREGAGALYTIGPGRAIDVDLQDENAIASFRVFKPYDLDPTSSFVRPAETDTERIAALLLVDFVSTTIYDEGFIEPAGVDMDACDYTGQRMQAVLEDCSQQSGYNHFIRYHETSGHLALHYRSNDSALDPADASISNVAADIGTDVFPPLMDWTLARDPSRGVAGVVVQYKAGSVIAENLDTSYVYGYRDAIYQAPNVATSAQAQARAHRYLADGATEDDRITLTCELAAADVNRIKQGQWLPVKLQGAPGYDAYRDCRVLRRDVSQSDTTDKYYTVRYELTPMTPAVASVAQLMRPNDNELIDGPSHLMRCNWDHDGDDPQGGDTGTPLVGLLSYYPVSKPANGWTAIRCDGRGTVDLHFVASSIQVVENDITWRFTIRKNGAVMATEDHASSGGLRVSVSGCDLTASAVTVAPDDLIYGYIQLIGTGVGWSEVGRFTIPNGAGSGGDELRVTGSLRP